MRILRINEVKMATGHRSHVSIYNAINAGLFTKPVPIGMRSVGWPEEEVFAINAARISGQTMEQIKLLVLHLEERRRDALMPYLQKEAA
jgi:prophage regulatory protein